jgi:hypothetical protein
VNAPTTKPVPVYCAGKIGKNDWRHKLFPDLRGTLSSGFKEFNHLPAPRGRFAYAGPFFVSCDHGCCHGPNEHGVAAASGTPCGVGFNRANVIKLCCEWLKGADAMFVWLDDPTAYGTLTEIGMAKAWLIPTFVATPLTMLSTTDDLWFPLGSASCHIEACLNVEQAWRTFEAWYGGLECHSAAIDAQREISSWMRRTLGKRRRAEGFVYVLRAEEDGSCKIGKTKSLSQRLSALSIQLPYRVKLEHSIRTLDIDAAERFFHTVFREKRLNGEWFRLNETDLAFLKEHEEWDLTV